MKSDILKILIQSHAEGDESLFRKAALQAAASESAAGHGRVAEELRTIIAKMPTAPSKSKHVIDITQPRGELADILYGGLRSERLNDVVLKDTLKKNLHLIIKETRYRMNLERYGVQPRRKFIFYGPPGCGKTLTAAALAGEMGLPLLTIRLENLFSRFLGSTSNHLKTIFSEMPNRPGIYLFDEFDAIGKARGDSQDVGEINRIVNSFLQLMDSDKSESIIIAATNYIELLDNAILRRFDDILVFSKPTQENIIATMKMKLKDFLNLNIIINFANQISDCSFADITRICDDAIRSMVLGDREKILEQDLIDSITNQKERTKITQKGTEPT